MTFQSVKSNLLQDDEPLFDPTPGGGTITFLDPVIAQQNAPAVGPATGDRYLVGTAPSGAWSGNANDIAEWDGAAWQFTTPSVDDYVYVTSTLTTLRWNGTAWLVQPGVAILQNGNSFGISGARIGTNDTGPVWFKTNNILRVRIDGSTGEVRMVQNLKVGDLTTAPSARIHISSSGTTNATYSMKVFSSAGNMLLGYSDDGQFLLQVPDSIGTTIAWKAKSFAGAEIGYLRSDSALILDNINPALHLNVSSTLTGRMVAGGGFVFMQVPNSYSIRNVATNDEYGGVLGGLWYFIKSAAGTFTPSAKVHIQGDSATNADYAFKIVDSASALIMGVRNDSKVGIGAAAAAGPLGTLHVSGGSGTFIVGNVSDNLGGWYYAMSLNAGNGLVMVKTGGSTNVSADHRFSFVDNSGGEMNVRDTAGTIIISVKATAATSHLIVYGDGGTAGIEVTNTGNFKAYQQVSLPGVQVGNGGLASGDTYFDTAANIAANSDLILARKV